MIEFKKKPQNAAQTSHQCIPVPADISDTAINGNIIWREVSAADTREHNQYANDGRSDTGVCLFN